ncbi:putative ER to Golgi transport-related protein [Naematelia encephala]|uniref:Putative ER to Golgi transport-related protein n=1 Tax=Naematelia encephala TaxID=71784 RepID=A0A1Y2AZM1_9TREE|nr:putative ER to Golgi transport-related protein [Naematelia encephala]
MPPRSRYAVDPSLIGQASSPPPQPQQWPQQSYPADPNVNPILHNVSDRRTPPPTGPYAPSSSQPAQYGQQPAVSEPQQSIHPSYVPPSNHIPPPPHSAGPAIAGPRVRIDPTQMPNPIEAQEMDQNLWDDEDFMSCQTKGVIPLAGSDWRGVDQGNSLPRHLRATLPAIPTNGQLLDTTALPFALLVQPFAALRFDEAPVPLVSNWVSGESAFDQPKSVDDEEEGPPRCEKCRGYVNPWVRWVDGGRKWSCNLCGNVNNVPPLYFSHLGPNGARLDHQDRPELQHGTVDFAVPRIYWPPQPPPSGSLLETAIDTSSANLSVASDALASTAAELMHGLQSSLGATPSVTRGPSPVPGHKEKDRLKKEEKRLRMPRGMGRVFVIDVSGPSASRGVVREVCEGIKRGLYGDKDSEEGEDVLIGQGERVAIITVGETVGFWNLSASLASPSLMIVSDLDDMFVPLTTGFLVDAKESRSQIESLLSLLPNMYEAQSEGGRVAAGSGVKGALAGLASGQINLFLSSLPNVGPGALKSRDDPTTYNTDKERILFASADPFWRNTAEELAECGVGVNTFLFPEQYTDVASIGTLSAITGGETFFHPRFHPVRDRELLHDELKRLFTRETVYNATLRIRCSNGLRVSDHVGNFYQRSLTDLEFGTMDDGKTFVATLKHETRLDDRQPAFVQVAALYTSSSGERRVRCLNMSFTTTSMIGNIFRFADLDASVCVFHKDAISQMPSKSLKDIRKNLTDRCNKVLLMYRRHCAPAVQAGQLILPEGFKLLPLFTLCMLKSKPLKGGTVTSDVRSHYMRMFRSASVVLTMNLLYPRLLAIHDLSEDVGFPGKNGRLKLPRSMRASYGWMVSEGAYLLSNGEIAMLWLGSAVSPQIIDDLYAVDNIDELDVRMTRLPKLPTLLSTQLRNILTHLSGIVDRTPLPLIIVRQNVDGMELEFANMLVEDSNNDMLSYADYLMMTHKSISNELSGSGGKGEGWRPW